jgi:hypothetical protein
MEICCGREGFMTQRAHQAYITQYEQGKYQDAPVFFNIGNN